MENLFYIFIAILIVDCLIGIYALAFKRLSKKISPLLLAVACSLLDELIGHWAKVRYRNNLYVYYFSNGFEYAFFVWFIHVNIKSRQVKRLIVLSIIVLFVATAIFSYTFLKEVFADPYSAVIHHNYFVIAASIFLAIFCICYFKEVLDNISRYEPINVYIIIGIAGLLFYYAFSTVYFAAENYLVGLSFNENPNLYTDFFKRKIAAFTQAYLQLRNVKIFLFLTNMLLYLCALVVFIKSAFGTKAVRSHPGMNAA